MRIIAGRLKGRRLQPPAKSWPTRPTTDFSREGLFNILENRLDWESLHALDLFGGSGSHSFELISRGCDQVCYVDSYRGCVEFVKLTAKTWQVSENIEIIQDDALRFIKQSGRSFNYIFAGPPYPLKELNQIPSMIFEYRLLASDGLFILEHNFKHDFQKHPGFFELRKYGSTLFSFFRQPSPTN
jgi:16S rRNA (guanine966-N2)-methyltransferase